MRHDRNSGAGAKVLVELQLVGSIEHASHDLGLSPFFVGVFVAIVGNAAERYVAIVVAAKDRMTSP